MCTNLLPTAHLSDVSRERTILLNAIMTRASKDVGKVKFFFITICIVYGPKLGALIFLP